MATKVKKSNLTPEFCPMNNPEKLQRLYQSYPAELLQEREVSSMVNNPTHDTPENITPVHAS